MMKKLQLNEGKIYVFIVEKKREEKEIYKIMAWNKGKILQSGIFYNK